MGDTDWFFNRVLQTQKNWWFFKFTDTSVSADTREFVRQLAFNIANTAFATTVLRLVLVNFAGDLPPDLRRLQVREKFVLDRQLWWSAETARALGSLLNSPLRSCG